MESRVSEIEKDCNGNLLVKTQCLHIQQHAFSSNYDADLTKTEAAKCILDNLVLFQELTSLYEGDNIKIRV